MEKPNFKLKNKWTAHESTVLSLLYLGNGQLASSGADSTIKIFDIASG